MSLVSLKYAEAIAVGITHPTMPVNQCSNLPIPRQHSLKQLEAWSETLPWGVLL